MPQVARRLHVAGQGHKVPRHILPALGHKPVERRARVGHGLRRGEVLDATRKTVLSGRTARSTRCSSWPSMLETK